MRTLLIALGLLGGAVSAQTRNAASFTQPFVSYTTLPSTCPTVANDTYALQTTGAIGLFHSSSTSGTCVWIQSSIQVFFGTAAPGSVTGNLPGAIFSDSTGHNIYQCNAPSGTAAPACTSVTTGGWTLLNGGGGGATSRTKTWIAATSSNGTSGTASRGGEINIGDSTGVVAGVGSKDLQSLTYGAGPPSGYVTLLQDLSSWDGNALTFSIQAYWFSPTSTTYTMGVATACYSASIIDTGNNHITAGGPTYNTANTITFTVPGSSSAPSGKASTTLTTTGCSVGDIMSIKVTRTDSVAPDNLNVSSFSLKGVF